MAAYPKTVILRADRRVCSNYLLTDNFVSANVLIFAFLFYDRDCPRKFYQSSVGLCICLPNICMSRNGYVLIPVIYPGDCFIVLPS